ncbi:MAG: tRNA pseudouridine(55) synthase TruB [Actinomycetota bacterium]|nr:tRNA pseudouridine(55) synthase TruB [Actinomycetota bacterium]
MGRRARRASAGLDGYVVVDKPAGMTSHDVVAHCRRLLDQPRAGHAGTLDPDATGVLVVGLGRATRLLRYASGLRKSYTGEVVLGVSTSTLDSAGDVVARFDMAGVGLEEVRRAAGVLTGTILQVPPMVSAVRVGGRRLHEIARAGEVVERVPRPVEVSRYDVDATGDPEVFAITVECSSGTYVRSLAADLGEELGGGAHLRGLRRRAVGGFREQDAVPLGSVSRDHVRPAEGLVAHLASLVLDPALDEKVANGRVLDRRELGASGPGPWAVTGRDGRLLAVYGSWREDKAKPEVVVAGPSEGPAATRSPDGRVPGGPASAE